MSPCRAAYNRASWCADALVPAAAALGRTRGLGDDASDFGRGQGWLAAPPAFVRQPFEPRLLEPRRPDRNRPHRRAHARSDIFDLHPIQTQQNDLGPEPITMLG